MSRRVHSKTLFLGYAVLGTLILAMFLACMGVSLKAKAGVTEVKKEKIVSVVCVKEGDTIWSIASDFYTDEYTDLNDLINEIKKCNDITDHICIGQNLLIPHYRTL